ncbi:hypothetical protein [Microlunatus ginsengisoli]|jgi:demethylmacrocin O-methyltransferase|uniref:Methyltransferase domain-containing protein n=1 Tax=Microlunatus ginsengisoli TaxID=363863 RepID=A0ABP6ZXY0_9ACTN
MALLEPLRKAAVRTIKPHVSNDTWRRIKSLDPRGRGANGAAEALPPLSEWDMVSLARHFGTDKWGSHRYAPHYEHHFLPFKNDTFSLLEIGIGGYAREKQGGASLRMWKAFFPNAQIIGLDIEDKSFVVEDRIKAYQGSQVNVPLLRTIVDESDNLQIIIDDGSHRSDHIRTTFEALFPLLPPGGLYAIEDTQTSYWPRFGGSEDIDDPTTSMALVKRLVDGLNYEEWRQWDYEPTYADEHVVAVHCYHNLVILEKGENNEGTNRKIPPPPDVAAS